MLTDMKSHITDTEQLLKEQEDLRDKYKVSLILKNFKFGSVCGILIETCCHELNVLEKKSINGIITK